MKRVFYALVFCAALLLISTTVFAVETNNNADSIEYYTFAEIFPDANFREYVTDTVLADSTDSKANDAALTAEQLDRISTYSWVNVSSREIKSLDGIELFTGLIWLDCWDNQLTTLDVSKNPLLEQLECINNQLTTLDISNNPLLRSLNCGNNQLTALDVSSNLLLRNLDCGNSDNDGWSNNQIGAIMFLVIGGLAFLSHYYTLDGIKSKTVGDGQHGTARWATKQEIRQTYAHVPFEPELWRKGEHLPEKQGLVLGCEGPKDHVTALVDTDDIHAMVTAASGAGKTAFFLYPNIEYALASGMSFLCTDTKGDLFRNYAGIAKDCYGYQIAVLDLRNPTRSDGNNLLHLINKYMDIYKADPKNLAAKAKAEKYSKILAKTLINTSGGESAQYGQNAFF